MSLLGMISHDCAAYRKRQRSIVMTIAAGLLTGYSGQALPEELSGDVVVAANARTVIWAAIHRKPTPTGDDPWYHVEVIAKDRRSEPWIFRRMSVHMAITPDALLASRSDQRAKTYGYKPEQFRGAYEQWRGQPREIREQDVCRRTILECLPRGPVD